MRPPICAQTRLNRASACVAPGLRLPYENLQQCFHHELRANRQMFDVTMSKMLVEKDNNVYRMNARQLISLITRRDKLIYPDTTLLNELDGWDLLKGVRLVLRLEEIMGRELSESEIEGLQSVGDVDHILHLTY